MSFKLLELEFRARLPSTTKTLPFQIHFLPLHGADVNFFIINSIVSLPDFLPNFQRLFACHAVCNKRRSNLHS